MTTADRGKADEHHFLILDPCSAYLVFEKNAPHLAIYEFRAIGELLAELEKFALCQKLLHDPGNEILYWVLKLDPMSVERVHALIFGRRVPRDITVSFYDRAAEISGTKSSQKMPGDWGTGGHP